MYFHSIDAIYNIHIWNENTIYLPSWAITFPGNPSNMLNYTKYSNNYISKSIYTSNFDDNIFQCLINTCNYFLPVKKFMNCMNNIQHTYKREEIDCLDSAVLFTDWLNNNNNFFVVESLKYNHRLHDKSNYVLSNSHSYRNHVLNMLFNKIYNL